jgi:hypothetical protein
MTAARSGRMNAASRVRRIRATETWRSTLMPQCFACGKEVAEGDYVTMPVRIYAGRRHGPDAFRPYCTRCAANRMPSVGTAAAVIVAAVLGLLAALLVFRHL